jgi:hypothetical protein
MREQAGSNNTAGNVMGGSRSLSVNEASVSTQAAAAERVQSDVHRNAAINPQGGRYEPDSVRLPITTVADGCAMLHRKYYLSLNRYFTKRSMAIAVCNL